MPFAIRLLLSACVLLAAACDWRWRRIPNWLTLGALAVALAAQWWLHGFSGVGNALLGAGSALALTLPLLAVRGLGAGDVKLMMAAGAFTGPWHFLIVFVLNALLGGVVAVVLLLCKRRLAGTIRNIGRIAAELLRFRLPHRRHEQLQVGGKGSITMPRGILFAIATLIVVLGAR